MGLRFFSRDSLGWLIDTRLRRLALVLAPLLMITVTAVALARLPSLYLPLVRGGVTMSPTPFVLSATGCAMAHCDPRLSDLSRSPVPGPEADMLWHDVPESPPGQPIGSLNGLGCVSNESLVACAFGRVPDGWPATPCDQSLADTVVAYRYDALNGHPHRVWSSGDLLSCSALVSAPMIGQDESVIAADQSRLVRFDAYGNVQWTADVAGGIPISPVITADGMVVLATFGGPVSAYDSQDGSLLDVLELPSAGGQYHTFNTPAVRGNRVYVITSNTANPTEGRLFAIDVNPLRQRGSGEGLVVAWELPVGAPNGASPLVVDDMIYFDADRLAPGGPLASRVLAVRDEGESGTIVWTAPLAYSTKVSFAQDPRGGLWLFPVGSQLLLRYAFDDLNDDGIGDLLDAVNVTTLVGGAPPALPGSAMTIGGTPEEPIMLIAANAREEGVVVASYVTAIDLVSRTLRWKVKLPSDFTAGQFPVLEGGGKPWIVFTSQTEGVWGISEP